MREWTWEDEYGSFSIRLDGDELIFTCNASERGEREMGFVTGSSRRTLESMKGDVPLTVLDEVSAAMKGTNGPR